MGVIWKRGVRWLPLIVVAAVAGCGTGYSEDMTYGLRDDLLIVRTDKIAKPTAFDSPGQLEMLSQRIAAEAKPDSGDVVNPAKLTPTQRGGLQQALTKAFGKPSRPTVANVGQETFVDKEVVEALQLDPKELEKGSSLYRRHCLHCHGLTGNGQGPTAPWVNPHPRDYRKGIFKFVSTKGGPNRKPSRQDLLRVLRQGVDGTSMPAFGAISGGVFGVLSEDELNPLASYVIHLSIRGQVEFDVINDIGQSSSGTDIKVDDILPGRYQEIIDLWKASAATDAQVIPVSAKEFATAELKKLGELAKTPPKEKADLMKELTGVFNALPFSDEEIAELTADLRKPENPLMLTPDDLGEISRQGKLASVQRGFALFTEKGCAGCHLDFGRRDNLLWDDWGTIVRPANITLSTYRGGRRPVDLYWRIYAGIPGANMPQNDKLTTVAIKGPDGKETRVDQPWRLWDVVNFVQATPYRKMLPEKLAESIHPQHQHK